MACDVAEGYLSGGQTLLFSCILRLRDKGWVRDTTLGAASTDGQFSDKFTPGTCIITIAVRKWRASRGVRLVSISLRNLEPIGYTTTPPPRHRHRHLRQLNYAICRTHHRRRRRRARGRCLLYRRFHPRRSQQASQYQHQRHTRRQLCQHPLHHRSRHRQP